jgi:hypothetical protein
MTADPQKPHTPSDDIDLLLLIEGTMLFFRRYKWVYIIATVLGLLSGILVYKSLAKIYTSSMVVHSFLLTNQEQIRITENWSSLLGKGETGALATIFNCDESILRLVKKIKAEEIQKVFGTTNPHGFSIYVNVTDNSILDELQKGIVYGFENNEYVRDRLKTKRDRLTTLIEETGTEIKRLDSTKRIMESIIAGKAQSGSPIIIDGSSINRQLIEMNEKLLAYKEDLKYTSAVQVLQSFSKFRRPTGPKLVPWLVIGLMAFLSLAFLYTLYSSLREKIKKRSGKQIMPAI